MGETQMIEEDEISLFDLVTPLLVWWKVLLGGACIGLILGLAFWNSKGFEAKLAARPVRTLDLAQWSALSSGLPALAEHLSQLPTISPESGPVMELASQPDWWAKNVTPVFTYSKNDIKAFGLNERQLDTTGINRIVIRTGAATKDDALRMAYGVERLIRDGGVYIALKGILSQYALDSQDIHQKLQARITERSVELEYLNKRAESIESLWKKYPDNEKSVAQSLIDPKDGVAKFLPLGTQLVAVKTEINAAEESLSRSRDRLEGQKVVQQFLSKGLPLLETETSGSALLAKLSEIEKEIRRSVDSTNKQQILALDLIAEKLAGVDVGYAQLFERNSLAFARRASKLPVVLGLVAGLLVSAIGVLFAEAFRRERQARQSRIS